MPRSFLWDALSSIFPSEEQPPAPEPFAVNDQLTEQISSDRRRLSPQRRRSQSPWLRNTQTSSTVAYADSFSHGEEIRVTYAPAEGARERLSLQASTSPTLADASVGDQVHQLRLALAEERERRLVWERRALIRKAEIEAREKDTDQLKQQVSHLEAANEAKGQDICAMHRRISALQFAESERDIALSKAERSDKEISRLRDENEKLESRCKDALETARDASTHATVMSHRFAKLQHQVASPAFMNGAMNPPSPFSLSETSCTSISSSVSSENNEQSNAELSNLIEENKKLRKKLSIANRMDAEHARLAEELSLRMEEFRAMEQKLYSAKDTYLSSALQYEEQKEAYKSAIDGLQAEKATLRNQLAAKSEDHAQNLMHSEMERNELQRQLAEKSEQHLQIVAALEAERDLFQNQLSVVYEEQVQSAALLEMETDQLKTQLAEKSEQYVHSLTTLEMERDFLKEELEVLRKDHADLVAKNEFHDRRTSSLRAQLDDVRNAYSQELSEFKAQNTQLTNRLEKSKALAALVPTLQAEKIELEKSVAKMANLANTAQTKLQNVEDQLIEARKSNENAPMTPPPRIHIPPNRNDSSFTSSPERYGMDLNHRGSSPPREKRQLYKQLSAALHSSKLSPSKCLCAELEVRVKRLTEDLFAAQTTNESAAKRLDFAITENKNQKNALSTARLEIISLRRRVGDLVLSKGQMEREVRRLLEEMLTAHLSAKQKCQCSSKILQRPKGLLKSFTNTSTSPPSSPKRVRFALDDGCSYTASSDDR